MRAGISSENSSSSNSAIGSAFALAREPRLAAARRPRTHAADIGLPFGHRDDAARIEQVETVRGLETLIVGRQCQRAGNTATCRCLATAIEQRVALFLGILEMPEQQRR